MKHLILLTALSSVVLCYQPFQVIFEWNSLEFDWQSKDEQKYAILRGDYIPANNFPSTVKFWKGKMYVTIPRWKEGVPITLGVASATPSVAPMMPSDAPTTSAKNMTAPKLAAFPNWNKQKLGDCTAFQLVHSIEIDPKGRMWVLDTGRTLSLREPRIDCPPRLVILDLENDGEVLRTYEFPDEVARRGNTYLNDIVLDHEDGGMAYITDNGDDPGIIVYSLAKNTSWKVRHESMRAKPEAVGFRVANMNVIKPVHVDGIALSPASVRDRQVYYSPLSSFHLYSVPVYALKNNITNIQEYVRELGRKSSQTDGMAMSATGVLYFGLLADDAIAMWDTKNSPSFTTGQRIISRDHKLTQWPDSFAFDEEGNFWCVTNMLQNFLNNRVNIDVPNYRFIRMRLGIRNYQYYENGTAPDLPDVTAAADSIRFAFAAVLPIILLLVMK